MNRRLPLLIVNLWISTVVHAQQGVAISATGSLPDASAMLDVSSSDKGILIPRMAQANRPASPATGLMIYQTDGAKGFYYYDGANWKKAATAAADTLTQDLYTNGYKINGDGSYGLFMGSNGQLISSGIYGSGSELPEPSQSETHMIWYPKKGAFRAGQATGTQWHDANTGNYSLGSGYNVRASGDYSVALGNATTAPNVSSFAMGEGSVASGAWSVALGYYAHTNARRGSFVFADNSRYPDGAVSGNEFKAPAINTFNVKASGGTYFYGDTTATAANAMTFQRGKLAIGQNTTPASTLQVAGSISVQRTAVTATYTATATDYILAVTTTSGLTINLPAASTAKSGRTYIIKAETTGAPAITIDGNGSETIDGSATRSITAAAGVLRIYCDGSNWWSF